MREFRLADVTRAFVIGPNGTFYYFGGRPDALPAALARCRELAKAECSPYAVDDAVVWPHATAADK